MINRLEDLLRVRSLIEEEVILNEVEKVIEKYFQDKIWADYYGEEKFIEKIMDIIVTGKRHPGDAPDMVIETEDRVLAIEHFEVDCYESGKKGSKHRIEEARIDRTQKEKPPTEEGTFINESINGNSSYDYYIKNVEKNFREHYRKIEQYIENIKKDYAKKEIIICFLIEDVSPLGTMVCQNGKIEPVVLSRSNEFLSLLENCTQVDYVMACSEYENNKFFWVISKEGIEEYLKNTRDYANMDFLDFKPHVSIYKQLVDCGLMQTGGKNICR